MKNLIKVIAIAFVMSLGVNTAVAQSLSQDQERPEVVAKAKVADLAEQLDLTGDQQRTLFRALVAYEVNYNKHIKGQNPSDAAVMANKNKFDTALKDAMKKHLDAKQYAVWLKDQ